MHPEGRRTKRRRHHCRQVLLATGLFAALGGCAPTVIDVEGHRVFNPAYLFYLESEARDGWQKPQEVLEALRLPADAVVADIGAGGGYFTERLARHLSEGGRVYAVDVQEVMIDALRQRVSDRGLSNVEVVRGRFDDPNLPEGSCDLVFFSSVYKEIDNRPAYLERVRRCLRPGGRVAILEYRPGELAPGPPRWMRLSAEQIVEELEDAGFEFIEAFEFLPRQSFQVFRPNGAGRDTSARLPS
ncbi:class I SAM-dependent methyltransferase [Anaerobaca lacustris]|uniref:Class I SAM-dependent methyltransferase n=1 Tax=Anaerobaca lacustris TaxID=3044600 RepID=A0AAW6TXK2_9BACT|nr:class I SAM-dependent methyltransferase [Sedimentisphaerales bacterium M17dextr]